MPRLLRSFAVFFGLGTLLTACPSSTPSDEAAAVTWYRDVMPLVQRSCVDCHFQGGIGPFSLDSYEAAATFASGMAYAVQNRSMPPWLPGSQCSSFQNARVLTDAEIQVFKTWSELGAPVGNPADAPPARAPVKPTLPWVDAHLEPDVEYTPDAANTDEYRCFVIDPGLAEDQFIAGYDIQPRTTWLVHHAVVMTTSDVDKAEQLDARDPGAGWDCIDSIGLTHLGMVGAWAPGSLPLTYPVGTGIKMSAGTAVVIQIHYNLINGNIQPDQTGVNLMFTHDASVQQAFIAPIEHQDFDIPANTMGYASTMTLAIPFDATLWGMGPHMHQLGAAFRSSITQSGKETCLIDVPLWNFDWQQGYFYEHPIEAKQGDVLSLTCVWNNPNDHDVIWGEKSTDEMCVGYYYITGLTEDFPGYF